MRIITEGTPSKRIKEHIVKCNNCGCEFAFTGRDLLPGHNFFGEPSLSLHCPYCGQYVSSDTVNKQQEEHDHA